MPNIEIHGLGFLEADALFDKVFELFKDKPYVDEMVVTICKTTVRNRNRNPKPFFRLVNSCQEHSQEIIRGLKTLGMDIERGKLEDFIPAEEQL
jgi:hypothetical protein